jgi:hypothetical protein
MLEGTLIDTFAHWPFSEGWQFQLYYIYASQN